MEVRRAPNRQISNPYLSFMCEVSCEGLPQVLGALPHTSSCHPPTLKGSEQKGWLWRRFAFP